jgi:hypothetical protein
MGSRGFNSQGTRPFNLSRANSDTNEILVDNDHLQEDHDDDDQIQLRNRSSTDSNSRSTNDLCNLFFFYGDQLYRSP